MTLNKTGHHQRVTDEVAVALVRRLAADYTDAAIAVILAKQGRRTATGLRWSKTHVKAVTIHKITREGRHRPTTGRLRYPKWRMLSAASLTMCLAFGGAMFEAPALAGDGMAVTPEGELRARYIHSLDRQLDPAGFNNFMWFVNRDCRWGVIDATFKIANSA